MIDFDAVIELDQIGATLKDVYQELSSIGSQLDEILGQLIAQATQPACVPQLGCVHPAHRLLLSANQDTAPSTFASLRRENPREEPGALAAPAGIRAGGVQQ